MSPNTILPSPASIRFLPFVLMLILSLLSAVVSCFTIPAGAGPLSLRVSLTAAPDARGNIYLHRALSAVSSVIAVGGKDGSQKIELYPPDWSYNPATTALSLTTDLPFEHCVLHVEGSRSSPDAFVLPDAAPTPDLLLILDGHLALEGLDYRFSDEGSRLELRSGLRIDSRPWYLQYATTHGLSSTGEWKADPRDRTAYLEASRRRRSRNAWYDAQTSLYFMAPPALAGDPPQVVYRPASPAELDAMKAVPVPVAKSRFKKSFFTIKEETGFDASIPASVVLENGEIWKLSGKFVEEFVVGGKVAHEFHGFYEGPSGSVVELAEARTAFAYEPAEDFPVSSAVLNLGSPVKVSRSWTLPSANPDLKPSLSVTTRYRWSDGNVLFSLAVPAREEPVAESIVRAVVKSRK